MIFEKEMVLKHAQRADVPPCFFAELDEYLDFALSDKSIKNELEQYYARLFECDELIFPITKVRDISLPEKSEQRYPGFFSTTIFLTAASYFQTFLIENDLIDTKFDFLESYYKNVRRLMEMNFVRDHTYALLRHGYFLYGYARPFILRIGRLAYELRLFDQKLYRICENANGERMFIAQNESIPTGCREIIQAGEPYVTIHIPGEGKLQREMVVESLYDAAEILRKVFSAYQPKIFLCDSWLISPQLTPHLKENANIRKFQEFFDIAIGEPCANALYEHVFHSPICPPEELVPQNDFQRMVLDIHLHNGGLRSGFGILKAEYNKL